MNKKLLFAAMSLAALTACTDNDFESKNMAQQEASPVVFEVLNNNDAFTRASWNASADKVVWSANDGDLFTLYHGVAALGGDNELTGYQNATYKASAAEGSPATLTTPSMILKGYAIMVWPVDTTFRATDPATKLTVKIPADQPADVENQIPYVSDLINIGTYAKWDESTPATTKATTYNVAGKDRKYPVYMRAMASQLNLKADYGDTENQIKTLYEGAEGVAAGEGIDPISVTSVELLTKTGGTTLFTTEIPLAFTAKAAADNTRWNTAEPNNAWSHVTGFDVANIAATAKTDKLTTECLVPGNKGAKFLILPQANMAGGVADAGVVVNTCYGKVVIADPAGGNVHGTKYTGTEYAEAWYRYLTTPIAAATTWENASAATAETSGDNAGKYKTIAISPALGMAQTINYMSTYVRNSATSIVNTEPIGVALTRYVNVNLCHLDMDGLHIKSDKQLRDAVRVWKKMGLTTAKVLLDGKSATDGDFEISKTTIDLINQINADPEIIADGKSFKVMPCTKPGEVCSAIVITGGGDIPDLRFIEKNTDGTKANVALNAGETWNFKDNVVIVDPANVATITNRGTMTNAATATLKMHTATPVAAGNQTTAVPFRNEGTWNITGGDINVQFDVTNVGTVNISNGAEYHQDGAGNVFTNDAETLPERFVLNDPSILPAVKAAFVEKIGLINNSGVLACVNGGTINNYGLIEHKELENTSAKTYITSNMSLNADGFSADATFASAFNPATSGAGNKIGRINLPYDNRNEVNVSIAGGVAAQGFVSVTVSSTSGAPSGGKLKLKATDLGEYVNYCRIEGAVTEISEVDNKIKYVEFDAGTTEIMWNVGAAAVDGMVAFSPVNVKRNCIVEVDKSVYLAAKMYVGGHVYDKGTTNTIINTKCTGYFGDTKNNFATMYLTY